MTTSERKEEILENAKNAVSEENEVYWDEKGIAHTKKKTAVKKGKKARASGSNFELRARKDLEEKGWTVAKWPNNFDLEEKRIIPSKQVWKYNPFRKMMIPAAQGTGFPDFIAIKRLDEKYFDVIGVEVKLNGILSKEEKEKCKALLEKGIFNEIWVAEKDLNGRNVVIKYQDFKERYKNF